MPQTPEREKALLAPNATSARKKVPPLHRVQFRIPRRAKNQSPECRHGQENHSPKLLCTLRQRHHFPKNLPKSPRCLPEASQHLPKAPQHLPEVLQHHATASAPCANIGPLPASAPCASLSTMRQPLYPANLGTLPASVPCA